jgi:hypothetical protein
VKNWFQSLLFQILNLYRYTQVGVDIPNMVGLYKLSPVDPQAETAWYQPLKLKS